MSRLYIETKSDIRKGTGKRAHKEATATIYWGSGGDSKVAGRLKVEWPEDKEEPFVIVQVGEYQSKLPIDNYILNRFTEEEK